MGSVLHLVFLRANQCSTASDGMKCPHCLVSFHADTQKESLGWDATSDWTLLKQLCPACKKYIFSLFEMYQRYTVSGQHHYHYQRTTLVYPKGVTRAPLSEHVPESFAGDYREACLTISDSAKASAALSRRCLQHLLREVAKVKP